MRADDLIGPFVNMNGTAKVELVKQYHDAIIALNVAERALNETKPHPRDYQTVEISVFEAALAQHRSRRERLRSVRREYETLIDRLLGPRP